MVTSVCSIVLKRMNTTYSFSVSYFNDYSRLFLKYHRGKHILNRRILLKETFVFTVLTFKPDSAAGL